MGGNSIGAGRAPVRQVDFDATAASKRVDHRFVGHGEGAIAAGGGEVVFPVAAAECHAADFDAVLFELE